GEQEPRGRCAEEGGEFVRPRHGERGRDSHPAECDGRGYREALPDREVEAGPSILLWEVGPEHARVLAGIVVRIRRPPTPADMLDFHDVARHSRHSFPTTSSSLPSSTS